MNVQPWIPSAPQIVSEALAVIGGIIIAGLVIRYVPALRRWVEDSSISVKVGSNES